MKTYLASKNKKTPIPRKLRNGTKVKTPDTHPKEFSKKKEHIHISIKTLVGKQSRIIIEEDIGICFQMQGIKTTIM